MFERFTDRTRKVLVLAQEEARLLNHNFIGTEHLLLGLLSEHEGVAGQALASLGVNLEAAREKAEEIDGPTNSPPAGSPPYTPRAKKVLELALREALQLGHNYIGTEHILLGIIREGEGVAAAILVDLADDLMRVRREVIQTLAPVPGAPPADETAAEIVSQNKRNVVELDEGEIDALVRLLEAAGGIVHRIIVVEADEEQPTPYQQQAEEERGHQRAIQEALFHQERTRELAAEVLDMRLSPGPVRDLALTVLARSAPEPPELTVRYESSYRLTHRRGCPDAEAFIDRGACRTCGAEVEVAEPHVEHRFVNGTEVPVQEDPPTA